MSEEPWCCSYDMRGEICPQCERMNEKDSMPPSPYDWRELHQNEQPLLSDGYTAIKYIRPGLYHVKGAGPSETGDAPERIWAWPWNGEARRGQWNTSQINDGVEYIRADLARPKVKPLEWEYHPAGTMASDKVGNCYVIDTRSRRPYFIKWPQGYAPNIETIGAAKAAAQADCERRILAALETPE